MEGHTEGVAEEIMYAHIHFDRVPDPEKSELNPEVISIDALTDQTPLHKLRGISDSVPEFMGITWSTTPEKIADMGFAVKKITAWTEKATATAITYPGIKQLSLVSRKDSLNREEFYRLYRNHEKIAKNHHGMQRYAQNIDLELVYGSHDSSSNIDAISELWFASEVDWSQRFYIHSNSATIVREDTERFIDFHNTSSILVSEIQIRR